MTRLTAFHGIPIFDGERYHRNQALLVGDGTVVDICKRASIPGDAHIVELATGFLAPGLIDLQVNGGGGVLFNDAPNLDGIRTICRAHRRFGTTALLPTLITDTPEKTTAAICAGIDATRACIPGFLGLHLEGPHLDHQRAGAHESNLIRPMGDDDLQQLIAAKHELSVLMVTVAPESVSNSQIRQMAEAGIVVSLGHSNATYEMALAAVEAGATCVTHLFNAMSPLQHRKPGMVGMALQTADLHCGLIADGHHVAPPAISIALSAKRAPGNVFLVSDAMSTVGTSSTSFELNGRTVYRKEGRLVLEDGTLAGADLDMGSAVRFMHETVGTSLEEAIRMASHYPAAAVCRSNDLGHLLPGANANIVHIGEDNKVRKAWVNGVCEASAQP